MNENPDHRLSFIFGRRSIRQYAPGEISEETVTLLLQAAMASPSAMTKDPWRFVIVRDKRKLAAMASALPGGGMLATAAVGVLVCGDIEAAFERQLGFLLQDCSAAIENLLLAAHALGLGGCWVGVHPHPASAARMKEFFSLPASLIPVAVVSLGLPGEQPEARTRHNPDYVRSEKW